MRPHSSTSTSRTSNLVMQFLSYIDIEKGLSQNTIASYRFDLAKLESWARCERKQIVELTRQDLRQWVIELARDWGLSPRSRMRAVSVARCFFRFLLLDRYIKASPAEALYTPAIDHRIPRCLNEAEIEKLLA